MNLNLAVISGDGIGPEVVREARKVLDRIAEKYGHKIHYTDLLMGGASIDVHGVPLTDETIEIAKNSDAVLMGSIGGNAATSPWYQLPADRRPEAGLLKLRKSLGLFANLRPAILYRELQDACPLRKDISDKGFDLMIMRELTGGLYFGARETKEVDGVLTAIDTLTYNERKSAVSQNAPLTLQGREKKEGLQRRQGQRAGFLQTLEKGSGGSGEGISGDRADTHAGGQLRHAAGEGSGPV